MKIKKIMNKITFGLEKEEYVYWFDFCDYFIEEYSNLLNTPKLSANVKDKIRKEKELLESIMFQVDVARNDKECTVEVATDLAIIHKAMIRWGSVLQSEATINEDKLKWVTNGANKRQLSDRLEKLYILLNLNTIFLKEVENARSI